MIVKCASNLRQIALGTINYANDNKGYLPTRHEFWKGADPANGHFGYKEAFYSYYVKDGGVPYSVEGCVQIGRLFSARYIKSGEACYCPSGLDDPTFGYNSFKQPWPQDTATKYRSDYSYNAYYNVNYSFLNYYKKPPDVVTLANEAAFQTLSHFPKTKLLAFDLIDQASTVTHKGRQKYPTWNAVFIDGHVQTVISPTLYNQMRLHGGTGSGWAPFEDYRDILEAQANGFAVDLAHLTNRVKHAGGTNTEINGGTTLYHP